MTEERPPELSTAEGTPYQPNELLTVAKICREYGIGRTTLYEWLGTGALPAKVVGKRGTRIRRADIDARIQALKPYKPLAAQVSA